MTHILQSIILASLQKWTVDETRAGTMMAAMEVARDVLILDISNQMLEDFWMDEVQDVREREASRMTNALVLAQGKLKLPLAEMRKPTSEANLEWVGGRDIKFQSIKCPNGDTE